MTWEQIIDLVEKYAVPVGGALVMLLVSWFASNWIGSIVRKAMEKARIEAMLARFFGSIARWTLFVVALISCLSYFGVQTTSFAAVIGASALAIGLAFQGSLSNLASGVMLLIFRPFKSGDAVKISGELGKIVGIEMFNTILDTFDNRRIILPNSGVFGNAIENLTHHKTRRVDVNVGVEYSADLDRTREVLNQAALDVPGRIPEPEHQVLLLELGDSSVNWVVRVWTNTEDYWTVRDALTRQVKVALDEAGLGIPFPQMDVHLDRLDANA